MLNMGSVVCRASLGPLLFSIFTNDLPLALKTACVSMYADDSTIYTTSQKFGHTYSFKGFSLFFTIFYNNSEDINTMKYHTCSNQISVKQIIIYFILKILQIATLCLDDSFAHSWHSLNQLHEVFIWNAFQLTGVPC